MAVESSIYWGKNASLQRKSDFMIRAARSGGGLQACPCALGVEFKPRWRCRLPCHDTQPTITPQLPLFWKAKTLNKSWQMARPAWALHFVNRWPACPSQGPMRLEYFVCTATKAITAGGLGPPLEIFHIWHLDTLGADGNNKQNLCSIWLQNGY